MNTIELLEWHAGVHPRVSETRNSAARRVEESGLEGTLAGMLRPFHGVAPEILADVRMLGDQLLTEGLDATARLRAVGALVEITTLVRGWALDPDSMLARNELLPPEDARLLLGWTRALEELCKHLCESGS